MDYRNLLKEENESVEERLVLARERILEIPTEQVVAEPYRAYFVTVATFLDRMFTLLDQKKDGSLEQLSLAEKKVLNQALYHDVLPENYGKSYANPEYAVEKLGDSFGKLFCMLYTEIRGMIVYVYEYRLVDITIFSELFIEIYNHFEETNPEYEEIKNCVYCFFHDYSELFVEQNIREMVDPNLSFATDVIMESDLSKVDYLFEFGEYISDTELKMASFLNTFSEEEIQAMADTYTEGYRKGFELAGIDLSKKKTVNIRYFLGFERIVKASIQNFEKMGLKPTIYRAAVSGFFRNSASKNGYCSIGANKQYDYDHKDDQALYLDKGIVERRLEVMKTAFETYKQEAAVFAGPAVMEIFGELPFEPVNKNAALQFDKKQQELRVYYANTAGEITNQYIHGDERSFTIIAYPVPTIGAEFEAIFKETVRLNTLDYELYARIQQTMIDVLDQGESVHVTGKAPNKTEMLVHLHTLKNPKEETNFENCVADVNIPVGEVFTSPVLQGTNGTLYVSKVYLGDFEYRDLELVFKDGMIQSYNCSNFKTKEENLKYIKENVLYHHETLPIGEFAIGTNTTAYQMGRKFKIADKLPILIAEKTGPHFAVGDTCYSHQEDMVSKNPDGKRIVARENECSALRDTDLSKAYFNCHTDITIPYDELKCIEVIAADGTRTSIIEDGKFVLKGTEILNEPLED